MRQRRRVGKILITGCSSGIGEASVREFQRHGWQVAATMRNPEAGRAFSGLAGIEVLQLDVTKSEQVERVVSNVEKE